MKPLYRRRRTSARLLTAVFFIYGLIVLLFLAYSRPSGASESDKTVTEGYRGTERVRLLEKPVKAKSGETVKLGYIGDQRIRLRVIRKNEYTETRGWKGSEYVKTREKNDG